VDLWLEQMTILDVEQVYAFLVAAVEHSYPTQVAVYVVRSLVVYLEHCVAFVLGQNDAII
jgi:hypothetical protein